MRFVTTRTVLFCLGLALLVGCATPLQRPNLPYPAFVRGEDIFDRFLVTLPGVRAKQYASDMHTQTSSNRIEIPPGWRGTTGGAPGKSVEIFVISGNLRLSEFGLGPGGYAYIPPGSMGFRIESDTGASVLYFLDEPDPKAVIRSPLILDGRHVDWHEVASGIGSAILRIDPGSGERTWLMRIEPGASIRWESSPAVREGYFVSGQYQHSECYEGRIVTSGYRPGGYFRRPPGVVNGGPASVASTRSVWFLREGPGATTVLATGCGIED